MSTFTTECYQNEYLPLGGSEVNAIVTVTSDGVAGEASQPEAAEIVIIDTSGSMGAPRRKLEAAREATSVAIDCIRDGVAFGVIAGTEVARAVYPTDGTLVLASAQTRAEAKQALRRLKAEGGTAIGSWLTLAGTLFATVPGRSCHAILLTDGENQHETDEHLDGVLAELEGRFQCDCRGVGTDWKVSELRRIASALLGSVDIIAEPEDMAEDFRALMQTAMGKATGQRLASAVDAAGSERRVRPPGGADDRGTDRPSRAGRSAHRRLSDRDLGPGVARLPRLHQRATARGGRRDARRPGQPRRGRRDPGAGAHQGDLDRRRAAVDAHQPRGRALTPGQAELADCIQEGLEARKEGDLATATFKLGRAVKLAAESGNDGTMKLLQARRRGRRPGDRNDSAPPRRRDGRRDVARHALDDHRAGGSGAT